MPVVDLIKQWISETNWIVLAIACQVILVAIVGASSIALAAMLMAWPKLLGGNTHPEDERFLP